MAVDKLSETRCKKLGEGKHGDGRGLYFFVRGGSRSWSLRYTDPTGRRREMSLGTYPNLSLAQARVRRDEVRSGLSRGVDPQAAPEAQEDRSVARWVDDTFEAIRGDLKDGGEAGRWMSPVRSHILPKLGDVDVTTLTAVQVRDLLRPIWRTKTSAAEKALQRLGIVMRHAAAAYPGEVDVTVVPNARTLLGSQRHEVAHIPAMPWEDVPAFYASLGQRPVELALRLLILTGSRSGPIRFAHVDQFEEDVWTVPASNMKSGQAFRVPLSGEALRVVDLARPLARAGRLFTGHRGKPISDATMARYLDRRGLPYRPHGFRSSFRMWCEESGQDWTLSETALAHAVGTTVQRSYQRSDLLEQRRPLMEAWAGQVLSGGNGKPSNFADACTGKTA